MTEADQDGRLTASRSYSGNSGEPIPWEALEQIFDAMSGSDAQSLRSWPETMNNVSAQWRDRAGVTHKAASLAEVREAYERQDTYDLRFGGWREGGKPCYFNYWPGAQPPRAEAVVQGHPNRVEAMIAPITAAFPLQRNVVFVSWSGPKARDVAEVLRRVVESRFSTPTEVVVSTRSIPPGSQPLHEMLERNLLVCCTHLVVLTREAAVSNWVVWEAAASWARQKPVIPIFVDVTASEIEGPLTLLAQGVRIDDSRDLNRVLGVVAAAISAPQPEPLSATEHQELRQAASS